MEIITLADFKAKVKALGYKINTKRNSSFIGIKATHIATGIVVTGFNVFTPQTLEVAKPYRDLKNRYKVYDGDWLCV